MKRLLILAAAAVALCGLAGTAYAAHGWGTGGDSSFAQTTIYDLEQYGTLTGNALLTGHPVVGDTLKFTGKIVTAIDAKSTTYGMWIEEPAGGPWSGLMVYCGGDNPVAPPSGPVMRVGDIVTVQGLYAEYSNIAGVNTVTELNCGKGASPAYMTYGFCIQITGHTTPPPPQRLVTANLRVSDTGCVEKWEGVLCELDSVFVTPYSGTFAGQCLVRQMDSSYWQAPNSPPACWTGGGLDTCRLNPKVISPNPTWTPGSQIRTVIGFVCQEYQWYYLAPRDLTNDVQYIGQTPPPNLTRAFTPDNTHVVATFDKKMDPTTAKNPGYYSMLHSTLSTTGTLSSDSLSVTFVTDAPMTGGTAETLYVAGVKGVPPNGTTMVGTQKRGFRAGFTPITLIQTPGVHHDSSAIVNEWITLQGVVTAGSATYKSGGAVFVEDPAGGTYSGVETYSPVASVAVGDNITVAGQVQEYNGKTEIGAIFYTVVNSSGNSLPAPAAVTIGQINGKAAPATAEMYEGMWVTTTGTVASDTIVSPTATFFIHDGADTIRINRDGYQVYTPVPGTDVSVCAILDYIFGEFELAPRVTQDMYCGPSGPTGVGGHNLVFALHQSAPNPFSNLTRIHYSLPKAEAASLKVYDVSGRLVRTLFDGHQTAGDHNVSWDGRTASGRTVSSGIYYYRLMSGGQSQTRKLVLSR